MKPLLPAVSAVPGRRGVALIITLLMLSVVTITAVAFLAVSRREREAVATAGEQIDARYVAQSGLNHAQGRILSRVAATTNRFAYGGFAVSTNFANPFFRVGQKFSFLDQRDFRQLTNVTYYRNTNFGEFNLDSVGGREDYAYMLGNLYYDPRPPVFVATNRDPKLKPEFRFFLDLNRNGQFETNGLQWQRDRLGKTNGVQEWVWGDPEWIGLLENSDFPHSGTNRFIGRFAYVIVPAGRTLDINLVGNDAKALNLGEVLPTGANAFQRTDLTSGFLRNQGVGSWELNLAGFFGALNTNVWLKNPANDYNYVTNLTKVSDGISFSDAERLHRFNRRGITPATAERFYVVDSGDNDTSVTAKTFNNSYVDSYSDGPLLTTLADIRSRRTFNESPTRPWVGSDPTNRFVDLTELFDRNLGVAYRVTGQYTNNGTPQTSPKSSYDRYTFYRMISQLGTDTPDARFESGTHPAYSDSYRLNRSVNPAGFYRRAKLNLNFSQLNPDSATPAAARVANFRPWEPLEWFTNATQRLLLSEFTNGLPFFPPQLDRSVPGLAIYGGVQVRNPNGTQFPTNYTYDAQVHRLLQLAANIYDATTNRPFDLTEQRVFAPTVFRPFIYTDDRTPSVLRLHSYGEVVSVGAKLNDVLLAREWISPEEATNRSSPHYLTPSQPQDNQTSSNKFNVFGVPWILGAKKGLPNFNQALWQTTVQPTRRLVITRPTTKANIAENSQPFSGANAAGFRTFYQLALNVTNYVGFEAWNSYLTNFPRPVRIFATNVMEFTLRDESTPGVSNVVVQRRELLSTNVLSTTLLNGPSWPARQYLAPGLTRNTNSPQFLVYPPGIGSAVQSAFGGLAVGASFIYDPVHRQVFSIGQTNQGLVEVSAANRRYFTPVLSAYITNSFLFAITDEASGKLLDLVTLRSTTVRTNLISLFGESGEGLGQQVVGALSGVDPAKLMPAFWNTNAVAIGGNWGISNQLATSLGRVEVPISLWRDPRGAQQNIESRRFATNGIRYFLYGILPPGDPAYAARIRAQYGSNYVIQVGFNPSPTVTLSDRRMANDPLVHYTMEDLAPGYFLVTEPALYTEVPHEFFGLVPGRREGIQLTTNFVARDLGRSKKEVNAYAPWGTNANLTGVPPPPNNPGSPALNYGFKDSMIRSPSDWNFPLSTNRSFRFAGIGELGRIHRGSPWQTLYLKSRLVPELGPNDPSVITRLKGGQMTWAGWAGNRRTNPTNDWKYLDLFTTAINDNAAHGAMGVNQTNLAAWSAVLSGVPLLQNTNSAKLDEPEPLFLEPGSPELHQVLEGYRDSSGNFVPGLMTVLARTNNNGTLAIPDGVFPNLGSILQVPTLSDRAPFLHQPVDWAKARNLGDEVIERVPQQIMSLLRADEPRFVIYSFGQTLKPAPSAVSLRPGPLYGMTTNYIVTGEYVTKTVLRLDGDPRRLQPVIEDQRAILSNN